MASNRRNKDTVPHEALHGFGLWHTRRESGETVIANSDKKYAHPHARTNAANSTDNIISYNTGVRKTTWYWQ